MDFNVLDQEAKLQENRPNLKIDYLQKQKQALAIQCKELSTNNKLLRKVIKNLTQTPNQFLNQQLKETLQDIISRNEELEHKQEIYNSEIQSKQTQLFLFKQIAMHTQKEHERITENYQEKILELRKQVHKKQFLIQSYEKQHPQFDNFEEIVVPPYNCSIQFHAQFEDYQNLIDQLNKKNKNLEKQNLILRETNLELQNEIKTCRSYSSLKNMKENQKNSPDNETTKYKNDPRQEQEELTMRKNYPSQMSLINFNNFERGPMIRKLLTKMLIEIKKMKEKIIKLRGENAELIKNNEILVASNLAYQKKRKEINTKLLREMEISRNLVDLLQKRSSYLSSELFLHYKDDLKDRIINNKNSHKLSTQTLQNQRQLWFQLKNQLQRLPKDEIPIKRHKRSSSSINDYYPPEVFTKKNNEDSFSIEQYSLQEDFSIIVGGNKKIFPIKNSGNQEIQLILDDI